MTKVVKKGNESGNFHETAVFFETTTKAGYDVMCMYERAGNFLLTIGKDISRGEYKDVAYPMTIYFRCDTLAVSSEVHKGIVDSEDQLLNGKKRITRAEFARHYNMVRMHLVNGTPQTIEA